MGYKIYYGTDQKHHKPYKLGFYLRIASVIFILMLMITIVKIDDTEAIKKLMLPGDQEANRNAIESMMEDLSSGVSMKDAIAEFAMIVVENENLQHKDLY